MTTRIIIADDHPVLLLGVISLLESSGSGDVVATATTPHRLMQILMHRECDVLVVDFSMPDPKASDGIAMLARIRRAFPSLPIVLLSAITSVATLRAASEIGVIGLIDKSGDLTELPLAVKAAMDGLPYRSRSHEERAAQAGEIGVQRKSAAALSFREAEILRLMRDGKSVSEIAQHSCRSITTISRQKRDAMRKLGIQTDAELFRYLLQV